MILDNYNTNFISRHTPQDKLVYDDNNVPKNLPSIMITKQQQHPPRFSFFFWFYLYVSLL